MTLKKKKLIRALLKIARRDNGDVEVNHVDADKLLIEYIGGREVQTAFEAINKSYA